MATATLSRPAGRLDYITQQPEYVSPVLRRFRMQEAACLLLPETKYVETAGRKRRVYVHGVNNCLRVIVPGKGGVPCYHHPETKSGSLGNLVTCSSVWACPVCAAKISERRRAELESAVRAARSAGLVVVLLTLTFSHKRGDDLKKMLRLLRQARKNFTGDRSARNLWRSLGLVGTVRGLEVTHGHANGWHPHFHVLLFLEATPDVAIIQQQAFSLWRHCLSGVGLSASAEFGVDVRDTNAEIADYVAKLGREGITVTDRRWGIQHEVTKHVSKLGRVGRATPTELLALYTFAHDRQAGALWREYALAFRGQQQLKYSPGLRVRLGLSKEKTDEQLSEEEAARGVNIFTVPPHDWGLLCRERRRGELVTLIAQNNPVGIQALLDGLSDNAALVGKLDRLEMSDPFAEAPLPRRRVIGRFERACVRGRDRELIDAEAQEEGLTMAEYVAWRRGGSEALLSPPVAVDCSKPFPAAPPPCEVELPRDTDIPTADYATLCLLRSAGSQEAAVELAARHEASIERQSSLCQVLGLVDDFSDTWCRPLLPLTHK